MNFDYTFEQRSAETFPTGLSDEEIMFENSWEYPDRTDTRFFTRYQSVLEVPAVFRCLFTRREGLSGTFQPISGYEYS